MTGVTFMASDKSLISFSLISTMWNKYQKDSIDMLIPFVLYSFTELKSDSGVVSIIDTKQCVENEFGIRILSNIIEIIFQRLTREPYKFLLRKNKQYVLTGKSIDLTEFKVQRENNKRDSYAAQKEFHKFLDSKDITYVPEKANEALLLYLCKYGIEVITEKIAITENTDIWNCRAGEFIQFISENDEMTFEFIKNIAKGGMIASIIFNNSISSYNTHKKFKNTVIYYDTSLLMYLLGYSGKALQESVAELTELLQKQNAKIKYFSHNLEELKGILNAYIRLYEEGNLEQSYNFDYFIENEIKPEQVLEYIVLLKARLKAKGLQLQETPDYSDVSKNIDWVKFDEYLGSHIKYSNPTRRDNDVKSLAAIYRLRKCEHYNNYETCHALFVTTNQSLAYYAKKYFKTDEERTGVPAVVDDTFLTGLIWLKNENEGKQLPTLKIVSDALSSQSLPNEFWNLFLKKIEEYEKEKAITYEEACCLKIDIYTKKNIYKVTDGDIDKIDHSTIQELLQRNDRERHKEVLTELETLSNISKNKDSEIEKITEKLIKSRVDFYTKSRFSKWKLLFYVSKYRLIFVCLLIVAITTATDAIIKNLASKLVNFAAIILFILSWAQKYTDKYILVGFYHQ